MLGQLLSVGGGIGAAIIAGLPGLGGRVRGVARSREDLDQLREINPWKVLQLTSRSRRCSQDSLPGCHLAAEEVGSDLGAVNDFLARETGNVGTGTTDPLPLVSYYN